MRDSDPVRQVTDHDGPAALSLSQVVEAFVQSRVLGGEWGAGYKLPSEAELSKQFNASRTVIREAIGRLQGRGLLKTINGSGTYVSTARLEDVALALNAYSMLAEDPQIFTDLLELRMALEGEAAAKVAARNDARDWQRLEARLDVMAATHLIEEYAIHDIDFHLDILRLSGNALFASLGSALRDRYVRFAIDALDTYRGPDHRRGDTSNEHREIVDAIANGDTERARQAARRHVLRARARWMELRGSDAGQVSLAKAQPRSKAKASKSVAPGRRGPGRTSAG